MARFPFISILSLLSALPLSATPESPLIPETWFQNLTATDGSTQQCIIFTTIPGVEYTFFYSQDLLVWTEDGETYGLGQEFAAAMRKTAPAPPPPAPGNPPAGQPVPVNASITIQPSSGTAGGTVVSWVSLDHGNAVRVLIPGNAVAAWQSDPFFAAIHGGYQFFILYTADAVAPPENDPPLDANDTAMIEDLKAGWANINTVAAIAAAANCNTPTPSEQGAKGFWRIKADWSLDTDNDGSPDHLEFALAAQAPGAGGLAGNAFNADTNDDGIPDGEQLDADGDSIPDARDIAPDDGGVTYTIVPLPRYAMFTFSDTPNGAFAINDRGTVLFPNKVWKAGEFQNLITDQSQIPGYPLYPDGDPVIHAHAINDKDQIIGSGLGHLEYAAVGVDSPYFSPILHWLSPDAIPQVVFSATGTVTTYAELWDERYAVHLDNAGNFFSQSLLWDTERTTAGPDIGGWKKWTLPTGANPLTSVPAAEFSKATAPGGIVWGSEYDYSGSWLESRITSPFDVEIPIEPRDVMQQMQGGSGILVATTGHPNASTVVRKGDVWRISPLLESALDIADDGTAIRKATPVGLLPEPILLNGKWTALARAVPGIPVNWKTSPAVALSDTSPGGWILAHVSPGNLVTPDVFSAALLPIRLKGKYAPDPENAPGVVVEKAVGVDDFSIGSSYPGLSPDNVDHVQDRIWIMAPLGGSAKAVVIDAPLHSTAGLKISSAPGITFSGEQEKLLTERGQNFTVLAGIGVSSGEEHLANLWINDGTYDTSSVSNPIGFKVMKHRTVNVTVYKIADDLLTGTAEGIIDADLVPQEPQMEKYLNDIYGPQVNVTFDVVIKEVQVETPVDHDPNGKFDYGDPGHSHDQTSIILDAVDQAGAPSANSSIRLFLLGTNKQIENPDAVGAANILNRTCWVKAKIRNSAREEEEVAELLATIAHEIGHIVIGAGHPSEDDGGNKGPAPLPGTRHIERLMWAHANKPPGTPNILVKAEWDKIEAWMAANVD